MFVEEAARTFKMIVITVVNVVANAVLGKLASKESVNVQRVKMTAMASAST